MSEYLDIEDLSFQYGMGVFDTVLVNKNGKVFLFEKHITRLINSLDTLNFQYKFTKDELTKLVEEYIESNALTDEILRTTITYGNPQKGYYPKIFFNHRNKNKLNNLKEFKLCKAASKRNESSCLVSHKTTNYMDNYLENVRALDFKFDDAFFINSHGFITETTRANLFYVKNGIIYTPEISTGLLPGVIRAWLIDFLKEKKIKVIEGKFKLDSLYNADEVFITNSVIGILSVTQVDSINYELEKANITKQLQISYEKYS